MHHESYGVRHLRRDEIRLLAQEDSESVSTESVDHFRSCRDCQALVRHQATHLLQHLQQYSPNIFGKK